MVVRFCFIILILTNYSAYSQKYFSKTFDFGGNEIAEGILYQNNDTILFIINSFNPDFDSTKYTISFIAAFDTSGHSEIKTIFSKAGYEVFVDENSAELVQRNRQLILMYLDRDLVSGKFNCHHQLYRMSNELDTIYSTPLQTPDNNYYYKWIGSFVNDRLLFCGHISNNNTSNPLVIFCSDTSGNLLWQKTYFGKRVRIQRTFVTPEKTILLWGAIYRTIPPSEIVADGWMAEIDSMGNIMWEKTIPDSNEFPGGFPVSINSSRFWLGDRSEFNKKPYAYIYKTDSLGNLIWAKKTMFGDQISYYNHLYCGIGYPKVINNSILGVGGYDQSTDSGGHYIWLIHFVKLDTLGNIKWRRFFKQWDLGNEAYRLDIVNDGYIISGTSIDTTKITGPRDAFIIKTDTNGCIIPGCHLKDGIIEVIDNGAHVLLYPNPVSKILKVLIDDHRVGGINQIEIYDANGNPVYSTQVIPLSYNAEIDVEHFSEGLYYVAVYFDKDKRTVKKMLLKK